jgi:hypothetical protein
MMIGEQGMVSVKADAKLSSFRKEYLRAKNFYVKNGSKRALDFVIDSMITFQSRVQELVREVTGAEIDEIRGSVLLAAAINGATLADLVTIAKAKYASTTVRETTFPVRQVAGVWISK